MMKNKKIKFDLHMGCLSPVIYRKTKKQTKVLIWLEGGRSRCKRDRWIHDYRRFGSSNTLWKLGTKLEGKAIQAIWKKWTKSTRKSRKQEMLSCQMRIGTSLLMGTFLEVWSHLYAKSVTILYSRVKHLILEFHPK